MTVPLPTWDGFLIPSLKVLSDGQIHRRRDVIDGAADLLGLTDEQKQLTVSSGQQTYVNRGNWAITHLNKAGAVSSPQRAHWQITDVGHDIIKRFPVEVSDAEFKEFVGNTDYAEFVRRTPQATPALPDAVVASSETSTLTPIEIVEQGQAENERMVRDELLLRLRQSDPAFFEQAVLDLLIAMGYGGSLGKATRTQLSNDGGIDGVIDQDALGLSRIYVQAKRYSEGHLVSRPEVQAFVGALHGAQANQGVFLTTSSFTKGATAYADSVQLRVVLIDGELLTRLMIRHGVGTQVKRIVKLVEVDEDFFE
ncbi:restriction endonuclease [Corynebacterium aquatimens]